MKKCRVRFFVYKISTGYFFLLPQNHQYSKSNNREFKQREQERQRQRLRKITFLVSTPFYVRVVKSFVFSALNFVRRIEWEHFCYYVLAVPRTTKKVFSRSNISDNSVQLFSPIDSNVQLLYLLMFFPVQLPLPSSLLLKGTLRNEDGDADDDGKDNSKYSNCTLECIGLSTCTEFSLKLITTWKHLF